jgi:hypothetical protein
MKFHEKEIWNFFFDKKHSEKAVCSQFGVGLQTFVGARPVGLGGERDHTNSSKPKT